MSDQPVSGEFVYADTDVPAGMTIGEWRAQRVADGAAPRRAAEVARSDRLSWISPSVCPASDEARCRWARAGWTRRWLSPLDAGALPAPLALPELELRDLARRGLW
jgi:hypothetical protein